MAFDDGAGARILFSVSSGTLEYAAAEGFQHVYMLCCGILGPDGCCKRSLSGTHVMTYAINSNVQGQLCTLPLRNTVIDCVAMSNTAQVSGDVRKEHYCHFLAMSENSTVIIILYDSC